MTHKYRSVLKGLRFQSEQPSKDADYAIVKFADESDADLAAEKLPDYAYKYERLDERSLKIFFKSKASPFTVEVTDTGYAVEGPAGTTPIQFDDEALARAAADELNGGTTADDWDEVSKGIADVGRWLAQKWSDLETRYGRKTALLMALALVAPGSMFTIPALIAAAEAARGVQVTGSEDMATKADKYVWQVTVTGKKRRQASSILREMGAHRITETSVSTVGYVYSDDELEDFAKIAVSKLGHLDGSVFVNATDKPLQRFKTTKRNGQVHKATVVSGKDVPGADAAAWYVRSNTGKIVDGPYKTERLAINAGKMWERGFGPEGEPKADETKAATEEQLEAQAYKVGKEDHGKGVKRQRGQPYPPGTTKAAAWFRGWDDAELAEMGLPPKHGKSNDCWSVIDKDGAVISTHDKRIDARVKAKTLGDGYEVVKAVNKSSSAFDAGLKAGQADKPKTDNPETHPDEIASWNAGWEQGQAHMGKSKSARSVNKSSSSGRLLSKDDDVYTFAVSTEAPDRDGDTIDQESLDWSSFDTNPVATLAHDTDKIPVGKWVVASRRIGKITDPDTGDEVRATLMDFVPNRNTREGNEVADSIRDDFLGASSVSFLPVQEGAQKNRSGGSHYTSAKVTEVAVCAVPANQGATRQAALMCKKWKGVDKGETKKWQAYQYFADDPRSEEGGKYVWAIRDVGGIGNSAMVNEFYKTEQEARNAAEQANKEDEEVYQSRRRRSKAFKPGDRVQLEDGRTGRIDEMESSGKNLVVVNLDNGGTVKVSALFLRPVGKSKQAKGVMQNTYGQWIVVDAAGFIAAGPFTDRAEAEQADAQLGDKTMKTGVKSKRKFWTRGKTAWVVKSLLVKKAWHIVIDGVSTSDYATESEARDNAARLQREFAKDPSTASRKVEVVQKAEDDNDQADDQPIDDEMQAYLESRGLDDVRVEDEEPDEKDGWVEEEMKAELRDPQAMANDLIQMHGNSKEAIAAARYVLDQSAATPEEIDLWKKVVQILERGGKSKRFAVLDSGGNEVEYFNTREEADQYIAGEGGEYTVVEKAEPSDDIDPEKACEVMRDGEVDGVPLTEDQRGMFGAACTRSKRLKGFKLCDGCSARPKRRDLCTACTSAVRKRLVSKQDRSGHPRYLPERIPGGERIYDTDSTKPLEGKRYPDGGGMEAANEMNRLEGRPETTTYKSINKQLEGTGPTGLRALRKWIKMIEDDVEDIEQAQVLDGAERALKALKVAKSKAYGDEGDAGDGEEAVEKEDEEVDKEIQRIVETTQGQFYLEDSAGSGAGKMIGPFSSRAEANAAWKQREASFSHKRKRLSRAKQEQLNDAIEAVEDMANDDGVGKSRKLALRALANTLKELIDEPQTKVEDDPFAGASVEQEGQILDELKRLEINNRNLDHKFYQATGQRLNGKS